MFDSPSEKSSLVGIGSVAHEVFFNDRFRRHDGAATDGLPNDLMERQFQAFENDFLVARDIAHAVAANEREGTLAERQTMSFCVAVQLLRTAKTRAAILREAVFPGASTGLLSWLGPDLRQRIVADATFAREHISLIQASLMWSTNLIPAITAELYHYLWIIARNDTPSSFYTSDAAIATLTHGPGEPPFHARPEVVAGGARRLPILKGLFCTEPESVGLELVFPVSPRCALMMFHPFDFADSLGEKQGKVLVVGTETVLIRNAAIAAHARRQVFATSDDFGVALAASRARNQLDSKVV